MIKIQGGVTKNRKTENALDTLVVVKIKTLFFSKLYAFTMQGSRRANISFFVFYAVDF